LKKDHHIVASFFVLTNAISFELDQQAVRSEARIWRARGPSFQSSRFKIFRRTRLKPCSKDDFRACLQSHRHGFTLCSAWFIPSLAFAKNNVSVEACLSQVQWSII